MTEKIEVPKYWYNLIPNLPFEMAKALDPITGKPYQLENLQEIMPRELAKQELLLGKYGKDTFIPIPEEVRNKLAKFRPTPIVRAETLEKFLGTPAKIYYKREDVSPVGSHKLNTSLVQAYYASKEGTETLITDTGAGQWGCATALSAHMFNLKCKVFMIRKSYQEKPYRVTMMKLYGAEVIPSPSETTKAGRAALAENVKNSTGSLGIGISEAVESVQKGKKAKLALGCMSNYAVLHQTIIGQEAKEQFKLLRINPDVMIGCVGGGSNFAGFVYPFVMDKLNNKINTRFLAAESSAVPTFTKGAYRYDYQDFAELMPKIKMYSLGHKFIPPAIHSGGLRYHGKTPGLSLLVKEKIVEAVAYSQNEAFEAGVTFAQTEGIIPAPESAHAVKAAIDQALECKKSKKAKTIVFVLSGHGLLDLYGYQKFLDHQI